MVNVHHRILGHAGLVTLMAVKAFGADAVAIADIKRDNLDLAMKLGADVALNPDRDAAPQEVATWMRAALPPHGPDMVIDCAGFEPTLQVIPFSPCNNPVPSLLSTM